MVVLNELMMFYVPVDVWVISICVRYEGWESDIASVTFRLIY